MKSAALENSPILSKSDERNGAFSEVAAGDTIQRRVQSSTGRPAASGANCINNKPLKAN